MMARRLENTGGKLITYRADARPRPGLRGAYEGPWAIYKEDPIMRGISSRSRLARFTSAAILAGALAAFGATGAIARDRGHGNGNHHGQNGGHGHGVKSVAGAVYTETNQASGNAVLVFAQHRDGTIVQQASVPTGGVGLAKNPPFDFPIVDSQAAVALSEDGRLLFAVNAGDNTITVFRVTKRGLRKVDQVGSGGTQPISVTSNANLVYVLNAHSGNIAGFKITRHDRLRPIAGSSQSLSTPGPGSIAAQIGFSPNGRLLTVSERCYLGGCANQPKGVLDTFVVSRNGKAGPANENASDDYGPFGFAYLNSRKLLVSNTGNINNPGQPPDPTNPMLFTGTTSSYTLDRSGNVVPNGGPVASGGRGACWIVITGNHKYAFVTNSLSTFPPGDGKGGIARYAVAPNGTLTLLGQTDVTPSTPPGAAFPTDLTLSQDGRYLYVLVPTLNMPSPPNDTSHIDVYRVGRDGSLTWIQATPATLPAGASGMAAS
jgi:6-phosphogluconolactonase